MAIITLPSGVDLPSDLAKCPDHDALFLAFMQLMPPGAAWDNVELTLEKNSNIRKFVSGLALSWKNFEDAMCAALDDWFCITSTVDEDMWKLDYGIPDECDIFNASVCAKVAASAGASPTADMLNLLLEANGYLGAGRWLKGNDPEFPGTKSTYRFVLDTTISLAAHDVTVLPFPLGDGRLLGGVDIETQLEQVRCMLDRYIPAHCVVDVEVSGAFDPSDLGAKLKGWWTADETADGEVTTWIDLVDAIGADAPAGQRPVSSVLADGFRWITFDGVDDYFRTANINVHPGGDDPSEAFALVSNDAGDAARRYIAEHDASDRALAFEDDPSRLIVIGSAGELTDLVHPAGGIVSVSGAFGNGEVRGRINGLNTEPLDFVAPLASSSNKKLTLGASGLTVPTNFFKGAMRHFIVTQGATMHEKMQIEAWLLWDVDRADLLPGEHPYKNVRP